jgi:ribulose-phosphate 3-epimerase
MVLIAPSLLAADFARLGEALHLIKEAGASMVHVDVMDGHFVPDISVGQPVVRSLRKATDLVLDVHLLIERPERYVSEFVEIGADRIAIHAEATTNLHKVLNVIRAGGAKAGLALNPSTAVESVSDSLEEIDYLLILSADLGFAIPRSSPGRSARFKPPALCAAKGGWISRSRSREASARSRLKRWDWSGQTSSWPVPTSFKRTPRRAWLI